MATSKKKTKKATRRVRKTTSARKRAAIDLDDIGNRTLAKVTGEELVSALKAGGYTLRHLTFWPEKKKLEYWTQPETVGSVKVRDVLDVIRNEKKKLEYETDPPVKPVPPPDLGNEKKKRELELPDFVPGVGGAPAGGFINEKKKAERELPPDLLGDDVLLDALADRIAERLKKR